MTSKFLRNPKPDTANMVKLSISDAQFHSLSTNMYERLGTETEKASFLAELSSFDKFSTIKVVMLGPSTCEGARGREYFS
jgi:hypothetical protein